MASKPPWWKWVEPNRRRLGAKALAAAGVLAAVGRDPYRARDRDQLESLLGESHAQVRWRYPGQRILLAVNDGDLTDLSQAWDRAIGRLGSGVRLIVDLGSLTEPGIDASPDVVIGIGDALAGPSMDEPARSPGDVATVSFTSSASFPGHEWQWPIRLAVGDEVALPLKRYLDEIRPLGRRYAVRAPDLTLGADIVVRAGQALPLAAAAGLELVLTPNTDPSIDWLVAATTAEHPVALMRIAPTRAPARAAALAAELIDQFAHNLPMDRAIFAAVRAINLRGRGLILPPPLIFIPGHGNVTVLDDSQLELQVNRTINRLALLDADLYIGQPSPRGEFLGFSPSSRSVGQYLADLRRAVSRGGVDYLRERNAGTALVEFSDQLTHAVGELARSAQPTPRMSTDSAPKPNFTALTPDALSARRAAASTYPNVAADELSRGGGGSSTIPSPGVASPPVPPVATEKGAQPLDVSAFAPAAIERGSEALVQIYLTRPEQAAAAAAQAQESDAAAVRRGVATLVVDVAVGQRIDIVLEAPGAKIDAPAQYLIWQGEPRACQFLVGVPRAGAPSALMVRAIVSANGGPAGSLRFRLPVVDDSSASDTVRITGDAARRFSYAFLSYASPDRAEVLKRAQALKALRIAFFQDLLSLEPGDHWEKRLDEEIDRCDLFLLFWSSHAAASKWVVRESERALLRRGTGEDLPPEIVPIVLEGPPVPPPPDKLKAIHFNDPLLYVIAAEEAAARKAPRRKSD
jgi:hypothetical protein